MELGIDRRNLYMLATDSITTEVSEEFNLIMERMPISNVNLIYGSEAVCAQRMNQLLIDLERINEIAPAMQITKRKCLGPIQVSGSFYKDFVEVLKGWWNDAEIEALQTSLLEKSYELNAQDLMESEVLSATLFQKVEFADLILSIPDDLSDEGYTEFWGILSGVRAHDVQIKIFVFGSIELLFRAFVDASDFARMDRTSLTAC